MASGIILCGFGFGSFVFNFISTAIANPDGLDSDSQGYFPLSVANNVPKMLRILAGCWLGLSIIGIIMVFPYEPEDKKQEEDELINKSERRSIAVIS